METYSTVGLPTSVNGRMAAWDALYATQMSRVGFRPDDYEQFDAELKIARLGPVKLARLSVGYCSVERTQQHIVRTGPRAYNFLLQAKGASIFDHCGHQAHLEEGDFVLCDTGLPHHWQTKDQSTTIMIRVNQEVLREYLPTPEQFCGQRLGRAVGFTDTVGAMVQSLTQQVRSGGCATHEARIARYLLEMISLSYTLGFQDETKGSAILWQRRNEVVRYIEDNLRDPELSPASIAAGMRIAPRYIRTIFSVSGERIGAYILRRRLEECAHQIDNPGWKSHSLTEIAFSWGFNSAAHFSRSFHEKYGMSPRAYRRR
jgi:AraC-like DNA-binding protein